MAEPFNKPRVLSVGLVGCGTIGTYLAGIVNRRYRKAARIRWLFDHHPQNSCRLKKGLKGISEAASLTDLIRRSDLILEAASPGAVKEILSHGPLLDGKALLIMSSGGLLGEPQKLAAFLRRFKGRLYVPSGAIAGIDGLLAAGESGIRSVKLITRKNPAGLRQAPYFRRRKFPVLRGREEMRVFKGSAASAIAGFPQNINVAALLSLAGIGETRTRVEIWTSTAYRFNRHEIEIRYKDGNLRIEAENRPSRENPRTSALALYAASAALDRLFSNVHYGT